MWRTHQAWTQGGPVGGVQWAPLADMSQKSSLSKWHFVQVLSDEEKPLRDMFQAEGHLLDIQGASSWNHSTRAGKRGRGEVKAAFSSWTQVPLTTSFQLSRNQMCQRNILLRWDYLGLVVKWGCVSILLLRPSSHWAASGSLKADWYSGSNSSCKMALLPGLWDWRSAPLPALAPTAPPTGI